MTDFEKFIAKNKLIKKDVARYIGVSSAFITQLAQGKREVPRDKLALIKANKAWDTTMFESNIDTPEHYEVPLLPVTAIGGTLSGFEVQVMGTDCEKIISPIKDVDFAITVTGESMAPEFPSGSRILIKKIHEKAFIDWGKTYVLDTVNGIVIKNIFPGENGNIICKSINPEYPDFEIEMRDDVVYGVYRVLLCLSLK